MTNKLYSFDPRKRQQVLIGEIIDNTIILQRDSKKHLMRVVDGYGIQAGALDEIQHKGIDEIRIWETNTGIKWKISVADWRIFGRLADYGNGKQWFVSRKHMTQYKPNMETIK